jgi:hypothetical protein
MYHICTSLILIIVAAPLTEADARLKKLFAEIVMIA